jgi:parallel beta-helix repeat protein
VLFGLNSNFLQTTNYNNIEWEKPVKNIDTGLYYESIHDAINALETKDNHTIVVSSGIYHEHIIINKSISLIGMDMERTLLEGNSTYPVIELVCSNVLIENFTIRNPIDNAYGIKLTRSNSSLITHLSIKDTHIGLVVFQSNENEISNIIARNLSIGILLDYSTKNRLLSNEIAECISGIRVGACSQQNLMEKNQIEKCSNGIELGNQANFNIFVSNYIEKNGNGVYLLLSKNCTFIGNIFSSNEQGIEVFLNSPHNKFFYNSFLFNKVNVHSFYPEVENIWDGDYPLGGNFWTDYDGADLFSGLYQNSTGSDGIGDVPYIIDSYNRDRYPLIWSAIKITNLIIVNEKLYFFGCLANFTIKEFFFIEENSSLTIKTIDEKIPFFCRIVIPKNLLNGADKQLNVSVNEQLIPIDLIKVDEVQDYILLLFTYTYSFNQSTPPLIPNIYIVAFLIILLAFFFVIIRIWIVSKSEEKAENQKINNA